MTLTDYKESVIVDNEVVRYVYPEDNLKASLKRIKKNIETKYFDEKTSYYQQVLNIIDDEMGAELNGQI